MTRLAKPLPKPGAPGAPAAPAAKASDGRLRFAPGEALFDQGDPGGDLFFIEDGKVEIFTVKDGETVILTEMGPGEIIGVMTCMTSEPRMASARAKSAVVCKKVPHDAIKKTIAALPNWMKIVLKEFTIRLTQMNKLYSDSVLKVKKLEATQVSNVYLGALVASSFATFSELMAIQTDVDRIVVIDDVLTKLEFALNMKRDEIDRVWQVLMDSGLLRVEIETDKKRNIARLANAQKLTFFSQFVRDSKHGSTKKLVRARFSHKETRVLSGLVKYAARLEMELDKVCRLPLGEVERSLERSTGVKFEREALTKAEGLKLLSVEGEEESATIVMRPSQLGRTIACVEAIRRLTALEDKPAAKGEKEEKAA